MAEATTTARVAWAVEAVVLAVEAVPLVSLRTHTEAIEWVAEVEAIEIASGTDGCDSGSGK